MWFVSFPRSTIPGQSLTVHECAVKHFRPRPPSEDFREHGHMLPMRTTVTSPHWKNRGRPHSRQRQGKRKEERENEE
jgi:hypothetical protein